MAKMKQKDKKIKRKKVPDKIYVITFEVNGFPEGIHYLNERKANREWNFVIHDEAVNAAAMYVAVKKKEYFKR